MSSQPRTLRKFDMATLPETKSLHLKITSLKRRLLLETIIFRGYVSLPEANINGTSENPPIFFMGDVTSTHSWLSFPLSC